MSVRRLSLTLATKVINTVQTGGRKKRTLRRMVERTDEGNQRTEAK